VPQTTPLIARSLSPQSFHVNTTTEHNDADRSPGKKSVTLNMPVYLGGKVQLCYDAQSSAAKLKDTHFSPLS
jgi:hypothetical protein